MSWLQQLEDPFVGIDEGGLTLRGLGKNEGERSGDYLEVGGIPDDELPVLYVDTCAYCCKLYQGDEDFADDGKGDWICVECRGENERNKR